MPPLRFLLIATTLVGLLHFYIGLRLLPDLPGPVWIHSLLSVALVLSTLLQPLGLALRGLRNERLRDLLSWTAMTAMGVFSSLLVFTVLRDLFLLGAVVIHAYGFATVDFNQLQTMTAPLVLVLALLISIVGFVNARRLAQVVEIKVPLQNLPDALHGFRIVQISDIHVGPTIKRDYLERIVERVNALEADLIAITGDLVDGRVKELSEHTLPLSSLRARHGSYFVTGNHEYYSGALDWIVELNKLGIRVLLNEHVQIAHNGAALVVAGVTDYSGGSFYDDHRSDPHAAKMGAPLDATSILLAHQPRSAEAASRAGFDLQLSGHTHGGQFWPWNYFVPLQQPYTAGLHRLNALLVYVSRGTGYWGPPKRFGAPSEITCLRLVSESAS